MNIGILGTGSYVPLQEVTNDEIAERVPGASSEWIVRRTGIAGRRYAAADEATSDLAAKAAVRALEAAELPVERIDFIIVATSTGDYPQPPTACLVQDRLGAYGAACFDLNVVCAGFVYGLAIAQSLVATRPGTHVLVVAADLYSRIQDFTDRRTSVLFGDGAGAVVVGAVPQPYGFLDFELISRGDAHDLIRVEAGGSRLPTSAQTVADGRHFFRMRGRAVADFVLDEVPPVLDKLLSRAGVSAEEVDHFVPHQANAVMLDALERRCGLTEARSHRVLTRYGNPGGGSVPLALDESVRAGWLTDGDLVLLAAFGGGMSIGACLLRWATPAREGI